MRRRSRVYKIGSKFYFDGRDFADVGGKRQALKPKGCAFATEDPELAEVLAAQVLQGLQRKRHNRALGVPDQVSLANYVRHHVKEKERAGRVEPNHMKHIRLHLAEAIQFFGEDVKIADIKTRDVSRWAAHLSKQPNGRGLRCPRCGRRGKPRGANAECRKCNKTWALPALSPGTIRHRLNSLSGMFRRALAEEKVQSNVVQAMLDKPTSNGRPEAPWLEIDECALLLEAARRDVPDPDAHTIECLHALVATHLLTGGRSAEVLGLCAEDISFDRKTVTFRPNTYRRLKTKTSHRTIPMQPQLEAILREHVFGSDPPITSGLLFRGRDGGLIRDWRNSLDRISVHCGWEPGAVRSKMFRHAYATHRLQCLDRGVPISPFIVAKELGHGGESLDSMPPGASITLTRKDLIELRKTKVTRRDLSVADLAEMTGRSQRSIRLWLEKGLIEGYKLRGQAWKIKPEEYDRFIAQQHGNSHG